MLGSTHFRLARARGPIATGAYTALAGLLAMFACAGTAQADTLPSGTISHYSYAATEAASPASDGDGIIGPGDQFSITENVISSYTPATSQLTNVQGALSTSASGVTISQGSSAYPNLAFGNPAGNVTPFTATLSSALDCGVDVPFTLGLTTDQGTQTVPFTVQTGLKGPYAAYGGTQLPQAIPDLGYVISRFNVPTAGRVKDLRVQINNITHSYDGDLQIELIAPDGTDVHLIDPNSGDSGQNFTNTVFDDSASTAITAGTAPFTGRFKPVQPLSRFDGVQQQGTWQLKVSDTSPGNTGTLYSWGASVAPAVCSSNPVGSFTATPNPVAPGATVQLDASGSVSPSGAAITGYQWDFDVAGDPNNYTTSSSSATTSHVYPARGSYTVGLKLTDANGKTSTTTMPVSVTQAPVAALSVSPSAPVSGQAVTFDASASTHDPAGSIVDYQWDLDGSGNFATDTGTTPHVTTSYPSQRTVPVSVRVTDDTGATSVVTQSVTVNNAPPIASFSASAPALVGQPVSFDATASHDIDGTITDYAWDFDGSGTYATDSGATPSVSHTYAAAGLQTVGLRVRDNDGATATKTISFQVTRPPVAALVATPTSPAAGEQTTLDASGSSSPDGAIVDYRWDLDGSGKYATPGGSVSFIRAAFTAGTHTVGVRVTDNYGATATRTLTLTVTAPTTTTSGGTATGTGTGLLGLVGSTTGGDPTAGIAALTRSDLATIAVGSSNHFAAIAGLALRAAAAVTRSGLWIDLISDRPASFGLTVSIAALDAKRLHLRVSRRATGLVRLTSASTKLVAAGQRAFDIRLPRSVNVRLRRLRGRLQLIVTGTAADAHGHRTALSRAFLLRR